VTAGCPVRFIVMPIVPLNEVTRCAVSAARRIVCRAERAATEVLALGDGVPPPEEQAASTVAAPASAVRRGREPVKRESTGTSALAPVYPG
jgi:hypothetical protein